MAKQTSGIESLIEKLSLYDLWNYFVTGGVFYVLIDRYTSYGSGATYNVWWNVLLCGFVGMIFNRVGAFAEKVFEVITMSEEKKEMMKRLRGDDRLTSYLEFIDACSTDEMVEIFWNRCSFFRGCAAMLLIFALIRIWDIGLLYALKDIAVIASLFCTMLLIASYHFGQKTLRCRIHIALDLKKEQSGKAV